jgi:KaiC/GvpD/RAD55 family RecA-like ATPase
MTQPGMTQPGMMQPGMMQPGMMQPGMMQPGMMQPGMQGGNPMMQMMQMMMGSGGGMGAGIDPAAVPFQNTTAVADEDSGLNSEIIRPSLLENRLKSQAGLPMGSVLDQLCLTDDFEHSFGGIPKGCTIALAGPPSKGKTRSALAGMCNVAKSGVRVAYVVAEEGFHSDNESGRDDLCSRLCKIGMAATGLDEKNLEKQVLSNIYVLECQYHKGQYHKGQYHKGQSWDDFIGKYRYLIEQEGIEFVVIDSLNMLDPSRNRTADNLSALKTYNHEQGCTCLCIGQIRDTGSPVGGEALMHTADAVFLIEELSLGSKEIAEQWGGKYRDKIDVINSVKSVTTPTFPHPIRIARCPDTSAMIVHESQPEEYKVLPTQ